MDGIRRGKFSAQAEERTLPATEEIAIRRISAGQPSVEKREPVIVEDILSILIEDFDSYNLMCTPGDHLSLALGFAFTEGLLADLDDLLALEQCRDDPRLVRMKLRAPPALHESQRNLMVNSSCGMCGSDRRSEMLLGELPRVAHTVEISGATLMQARDEMQHRQSLFEQTGGAHGAGIFTPQGALVSFAEDLGRHNALDKAIGQCLRKGLGLTGLGGFLSGRVSYEMIAKSARAGLEVVAAISAPTSLAIAAAEKSHITLCGFVRKDRATIYTHPGRFSPS